MRLLSSAQPYITAPQPLNGTIMGKIFHSKILPSSNEVWGKVMFLHLCVILFPGGGLHPGGRSSFRWIGVCIQGRDWPTSPLHRILWDTVNERTVRILLECILVVIEFNEFGKSLIIPNTNKKRAVKLNRSDL